MLAKRARTLRSAIGVGDEDVLSTGGIEAIAERVGLRVRHHDDLIEHAMIVRDTFYLPLEVPVPNYRLFLLYGLSRRYLFGDEALVIYAQPRRVDQDTQRAITLAGYLALGPSYAPPTTTAEAKEVARLGNLPEWAVVKLTKAIERDRAEHECWRDPDLGRRVRALARDQGLTMA